MNILYDYIGLPKFWSDIGSDKLDVSEIKVTKILEGFSKLPSRPVKILVIGQVAPIINKIIESQGINSTFGVNFIDYFSSTFKQEEYDLRYSKFLVIYNVGFEKAVNLGFSKQLLQGLIQNGLDNGSHVILQSTSDFAVLKNQYGLDFQNILRLPELPDDKLF